MSQSTSKPLKRHPLAIAIEKWLKSQEGKECCNHRTLQAPQRMSEYLRNRLRYAFEAGWTAKAKGADPVEWDPDFQVKTEASV